MVPLNARSVLLSSLRTGIPQGRIQLSAARQQQIRVSCAAFSTVLQYAAQYNVSDVEIREIIRYLDGRMSLIAGTEVDELARIEDGSDVRPPLQEVPSSIDEGFHNGTPEFSYACGNPTDTTTVQASTSTSETQRPELPSPHLPNDTNGLGLRSLGSSSSRSISPIAVTTSSPYNGSLSEPNIQRVPNAAATAQVPGSTSGRPETQLPLPHPPSGIKGLGISTHGIPLSRSVAPIATTIHGSRNGTATSSGQVSTSTADSQKPTLPETNPTMILSGIQPGSRGIPLSRSESPIATTSKSIGIIAQTSVPTAIGVQRPHMFAPHPSHEPNSVGRDSLDKSSSRSVSPNATTARGPRSVTAVTTAPTPASIVQAQRTMSASPYWPMVSSGIQLNSNGISSPGDGSPVDLTSRTFSPVLSTSANPTTARPDGVDNRTPLQNGLGHTQEFSALAGAVVPTPEQTENNLRRRSSGASFSALAEAVVPTPERTENNLLRRSSGAQSRPSSATSYGRKGSDVVAEVNLAVQPFAASSIGSRISSLQLQPGIVTSGSGMEATGYRISSKSPHQSSAASFASPTPPLGTVISPTLSASGSFSSPLLSGTSPSSWPEQATASTSYSAAYATQGGIPNDTSGPTRQRSSLQGVLNTSARTSLPAPRPPTISHNTGPSNGSVRKIAVGSNGVVAGSTATTPSHASRTDAIGSLARSGQVLKQNLLASPTAASLALLQQAQMSSLKAMSAVQGGATVPPVIGPPPFDRMHVGDEASRPSIRHDDELLTDAPTAMENGASPSARLDTSTFKTPPVATYLSPSALTTVLSKDVPLPIVINGSVPSEGSSQPIAVIDTDMRDPQPSKAVSGHDKELGLMIAKKAHDNDRIKPSTEQPSKPIAIASPASETVPFHAPSAEADTVMGFLDFDFKPPAKPIPSLPDWLSGADTSKKRAESRPSLPDWASGRLEEAGFAIMPSVNGNKRRRTKSPDRLWFEGGVGCAELPIDVDDAQSDIDIPPASPDVQDSTAQMKEQALDIHVDDAEPVVHTWREAVAFVQEEYASSLTRQSTVPSPEETSKAPVDVNSAGSVPPASGRILCEDGQSVKHPVQEDGLRTTVRPAPAPLTTAMSSAPPAIVPDDDVDMLDATTVETGLDSEPVSSPSTNQEPDVAGAIKLMDLGRPSSGGTAKLDVGSSTQDGAISDRRSPAHPDNGNEAGTASTLSGSPTAVLGGLGVLSQEETSRPVGPIVHHISLEITSEDIVRWQRKVWRACFCEWVGCGAVLNSWESLEKVRTQSVFVRPAY